MKYGINTLDDFCVEGKTVLCRVDINSPIDRETGALKDTTRIVRCLPTLKELSERGAKTVLMAHQGGDLEYKNFASTENHAGVLSNLLARPVGFVDDVCGPAARNRIKELRNGEILLLDNVRFMSEEMTLFETSLKLDPAAQSKTLVVRKLAPLADLYVCDAFAAAHRSQPTLVGFQEVLPSAMGRLFEEELTALSSVTENPRRPCVFFLGGAKIQDAFIMMKTVLENGTADTVLTGGLVANIMLLAAGTRLGEPSENFIFMNSLSEYIEVSQSILDRYRERVVLPSDLAFKTVDRSEVKVEDLPVERLLVDIGHRTVEAYRKIIAAAKTIFINGPAGVFEEAQSEYGTKSIWEATVQSGAYSVIGGGDSIAAMNKYSLADKFSYVCTAGGGLVRFLSGEELPVVKALRRSAEKFSLAKAGK
ncbi:MAG TPA: phosphoglycerate kinase [Bacillota bacterium]|nr:phosphoglycerate kinase [Bacillota bacterium]